MWYSDTKLSVLERICVSVLNCGPIPRHVAIIMDGNRRFARLNSLDSVHVGHVRGFDKLTQTMQWCSHIGIKELTVYALSIENFKRPKEEVEGLMDLMRQKFNELSDEKSKANERGVRVRVFGDLSLLPSDIQKLMADIVIDTKNNDKYFLNLCIAYTSRQEITNAFNELSECVQNKLIEPKDINESLLSKFLYTMRTPEPDLLVRTSGEHRLSDFLLWQSSFSVIAFADVLWPEFTIWDLFCAVFYYQMHCSPTKLAKEKHEINRDQLERNSLLEQFEFNENEDNFETFKLKKSRRIDQCLTYLENKRMNKFEDMCKIII